MELGLTSKMPRLVACQVDAANPLFLAAPAKFAMLTPVTARETHASAIRIGNPVSFPRAKRALLATEGLVTSCSEAELLGAAAQADRAGHFTCPHTATALAGVRGLARDGVITAKDVVVVVSTASGLKFADQKARYHEGSTALGDLDLPPEVARWRNPPARIPGSVDDVRRALAERGIA
jgi:threonine synthase